MLCKWQVKKLCIFYIQLSIRDRGEVLGERLDPVFKLWPDCDLSQLIISLHVFPVTPLPPLLFFPKPLPFSCISLLVFNLNIYSPSRANTSLSSVFFCRTWPQFVNILPLAHPLCWYNDHLTVKSKARRKLGRRRQRGQQHWSNYVSFSPSIFTLMKSLIVRGRGRWGGEDRCTKCTSFIYLILWNERKERQE